MRVDLGDRSDTRSYSIVRSSDDGRPSDDQRSAGAGSRGAARCSCTPCSRATPLRSTQPLQNFPLRVGAQRYVLLAGGIGITAMVDMARVLKAVKADYTARLRRPQPRRDGLPAELEELHGDRLRVHVDDEGTPLDVWP